MDGGGGGGYLFVSCCAVYALLLEKVGVEKTFEAWLQMHQNFSGLFETLGEKHTPECDLLFTKLLTRVQVSWRYTLNSPTSWDGPEKSLALEPISRR